MGIPAPARCGWSLTQATRGGQRRCPRDCLESTASTTHAISEADGTRQEQREGSHRSGARVIGFYLGHRGKSRSHAQGAPATGSIKEFLLKHRLKGGSAGSGRGAHGKENPR